MQLERYFQTLSVFRALAARLVASGALKTLLIVLLLLFIARSLATVFWIAFAPTTEGAPQLVAANLGLTQYRGEVRAPIDIEQLKSIRIFGVARQLVQAPEPVVDDIESRAVETRLKLTLQGLMQGDSDNSGGAIIASNQKQKFYQVGEFLEVQGRVKLAKVLADRVILENNGRYESLRLYEDEWSAATEIVSNEFLPDADAGQLERALPLEEVESIRRDIDQRGLKALSELINFRVQMQGGRMLGYRIAPGQDARLFTELGLKNGDIVTAINGIELSDVSRLASVMKELESATSADLAIVRGDETLDLSVNIE
ncbi:type II secretion system protein GspC [Pseudomaricurvus alcaniphilus]|uniref:type II secretion system protein GspC n=1 Tax=Pseudomaricurvus alcaniphilus TaxID=1166482 RepID=UPI0014089331|nr:type II secretion system protein GspC [Pseudomaricurvus alcaniphilus]NHN36686.1 type II secretion system protein GspC [Pseudomaricurvus alcaniphilus]